MFGDLLAREGDLTQARRMYETALSTEASLSWPYRAATERRRDDVAGLQTRWAVAPERGAALSIDDVPMFSGPANCSLCHQGP